MDIDIVIPWVDGSDPDWQAEKARCDAGKRNDGNSVSRFRDWGLLPFWFRAVEKYIPWVRTVHFLTWGHLPAFLNTEHPKLHIVSHREFIPAEYLPTFSSHTIDMNLHRIPGLAEHFVYFNDDTFLLRPLPPKTFFRDGLPCVCGEERPIELSGRLGIWQHAAVNDLGAVNAHFSKREQVAKYRRKYVNPAYRWQDNVRTLAMELLFPDRFTGFVNPHAPTAYRKQTFEEVWAAEPELMHVTSASRFRAADGANQWLFLWWQAASGQFAPTVVDNVVCKAEEGSVASLCRTIRARNHDMICINDPEEEIDFGSISARLRDAFEAILPEKSGFEK